MATTKDSQNLTNAGTALQSNYAAPIVARNSATNVADTVDQSNGISVLDYLTEKLKYKLIMDVRDYQRYSINTVSKGKTVGIVSLPLPMNLVNPMSVDYQEENSSMLTNIAQLGGNYSSSGAELPTSTNNSNQAETDFSKQMGKLGSVAGFAGAQAMTGYSPNQFMVVLLKGPKYKVFEMSWKLAPRNASESENLRKIINFLNINMSPGLEFGNTLFSFPKVFNLAFIPNHKQLYRFKPAVLKDLVVNYAGGGMPMFFGDSQAPESVELRMTFMEIEYWLNADFVDETNKFAGRGENITVSGNYGIDFLNSVADWATTSWEDQKKKAEEQAQ